MAGMLKPRKLDHVALWVSDPEEAARAVLARLPFRVLEEGDDFLLLGRSPDLGKLTLFEAPGPRERGALLRVGIGIPCGTERTTIELDDDLSIELVPSDPSGEVDLDHVALQVPDPGASIRDWMRLGLERDEIAGTVQRARLGDAVVELQHGSPHQTERPLLNHLGFLVSSIEHVRRSVAEHDLHVMREVEAENSFAVFVRGPDGVEVEYIEHKPSFALA
jgi:catechol 2,3-dioxygenase-like lactoylglutathione lyase family enzyme